jgi:hypothetical protein
MTFNGIAYASGVPAPMHESAVAIEESAVSLSNALLVQRHNAVVARTRFTPCSACEECTASRDD